MASKHTRKTEQIYRWEVTDIPLKEQDFPKTKTIQLTQASENRHRVKSTWKAQIVWNKEGGRLQISVQLQQQQQTGNIIELPIELEVRTKHRLDEGEIRYYYFSKPTTTRSLSDNSLIKFNWSSIHLSEEDMKTMTCADGTLVLIFMIVKAAGENDNFLPGAQIKQEKFYRMVAKLENDEKNSDVKIVSSDGQEFFAYRWILSEVSGVFEAMFRSDMVEQETGVVKLQDLSGATVKLLLHFIYSERVLNNWSSPEIIEELIYAVDKYHIVELKEFLDSNLGKFCTVENAGVLLAVAQRMSMKQADADILAFIRDQCKDAQGFFEIVKRTKVDY